MVLPSGVLLCQSLALTVVSRACPEAFEKNMGASCGDFGS